MGREIKFRAWEETRKIMFEPNVIDLMVDFVGNIYSVDIDGYKPVNDLKIMQYTGLTDINSKEIFEGDIVSRKYFNLGPKNIHDFTGVVEYCEGTYFITNPNNTDECAFLFTESEDNEVIGNIYENPELLETPNE